jgi:hypothetical protein
MLRTCLALAVFCTFAMTAMAGGPPVMYAVVDKVVLSPNAEAPDRIQIWGSFTRGSPEKPYEFGRPVYGYLNLSIDPKQEKLCRTEWAKWQKAAGTGKAVTVGHCGEAGNFLKAKIYKPDEKAEKPDQVYSVEMIERFGGLYVDGDVKNESPVRALLLFAKERQKSEASGQAKR